MKNENYIQKLKYEWKSKFFDLRENLLKNLQLYEILSSFQKHFKFFNKTKMFRLYIYIYLLSKFLSFSQTTEMTEVPEHHNLDINEKIPYKIFCHKIPS